MSNQCVQQLEAAFVAEIQPIPPPPLDLFLVVAYYLGPGMSTKSWKLFSEKFTAEGSARAFAEALPAHYQYRTIYHLNKEISVEKKL